MNIWKNVCLEHDLLKQEGPYYSVHISCRDFDKIRVVVEAASDIATWDLAAYPELTNTLQDLGVIE